jgi:hypothetical protein
MLNEPVLNAIFLPTISPLDVKANHYKYRAAMCLVWLPGKAGRMLYCNTQGWLGGKPSGVKSPHLDCPGTYHANCHSTLTSLHQISTGFIYLELIGP